jgi:hypothetical protein
MISQIRTPQRGRRQSLSYPYSQNGIDLQADGTPPVPPKHLSRESQEHIDLECSFMSKVVKVRAFRNLVQPLAKSASLYVPKYVLGTDHVVQFLQSRGVTCSKRPKFSAKINE